MYMYNDMYGEGVHFMPEEDGGGGGGEYKL